MKEFDAIVLGGGPGGYECAIRLADNGLKTALVEEDTLGGTCLNRGCIPAKSLLHSAELYRQACGSAAFGVTASDVKLDYAKVIDRKDAVVARLTRGVAFLEKNHGVEVFKARGELSDSRTVSLSDGETLRASKALVLATGSSPASIPVPGTDLKGVVDSTGLLEIREKPSSIVIVGGGVIGIEFASFYSAIGVKVTILEMLPSILATLDADVSAAVASRLSKDGVEIFTGVRVTGIAEGLKVSYAKADGTTAAAEGDVVLIAGGRRPNSRNIGLEKAGVETDRRGFVQVDGLCRTNVPGVYAIGDLNGKMQLAHVASAQGLLVADHIAGKAVKQLDMNHIPSCVYCTPEAAMIGLTEKQAKESGRDTGVGRFDLAGNGKALTSGENSGFVKIVFDKKTQEILGCHIVGPRATDLVAEVSAVMESEGTVTELGRAVHPHPTVSEAVMEAAHACCGGSVNAPKQKK